MSTPERITDEEPEPIPKPLIWNERTFKYCLTKVKVKARYENGVLYVRTDNVGKFGEMLIEHGVEAGDVIKWLNERGDR